MDINKNEKQKRKQEKKNKKEPFLLSSNKL
jgi:hypothetical protein